MMTQQDFNHNLLGAIDALNQIIWNKHLLEIAIEHTATYNEKNFNRVSVLLDSYRGVVECELETLQTHLTWLQENNHNLHSGSRVSDSTTLHVTTTVSTSTSTV